MTAKLGNLGLEAIQWVPNPGERPFAEGPGFDFDPVKGRNTFKFDLRDADPTTKYQAHVDRRRYRRTAGVTDKRLVGRGVAKGKTVSSGSPLIRKLARHLFHLSAYDWDRQHHTVGSGEIYLSFCQRRQAAELPF